MSDDDGSNSDVLAEQINTVVGNVREAIRQADAQSPGAAVTAIDLTLTAVLTHSAGLDIKFKLFGHDVGLVIGGSEVSTQTIDVSLTPLPAVESFGATDLTDRLASAITTVRDAMASAATNSQGFGLTQATVEIDFELDTDGSIDFVVTGERKSSATQSVKLTLASPK
jgi:hypothetical protein